MRNVDVHRYCFDINWWIFLGNEWVKRRFLIGGFFGTRKYTVVKIMEKLKELTVQKIMIRIPKDEVLQFSDTVQFGKLK